MKQIEKNKETLWEHIERLCNQPINRSSATELNTYMGALKAICMICGEEDAEHASSSYIEDKSSHTPELDGDTEFERIIMKIPMDSTHIMEVFKIFSTHMDQMEVVNNRAYSRIIDQLKEVSKV